MKFTLLFALALVSLNAQAAPIHRTAALYTTAGTFALEIDVFVHTASGLISAASDLSNPCDPCEDCTRCTTTVKHSGVSIKATLKDTLGKVISVASQDSVLESLFEVRVAPNAACNVNYPIGKLVGFHHPSEFMTFILPGSAGELAISIPMAGSVKFSSDPETEFNLNPASLTSVQWFLNHFAGGIATLVDPLAPIPVDPPIEDYDVHH